MDAYIIYINPFFLSSKKRNALIITAIIINILIYELANVTASIAALLSRLTDTLYNFFISYFDFKILICANDDYPNICLTGALYLPAQYIYLNLHNIH